MTMITVLLENTSLRDLSVSVKDMLQAGEPEVFQGVLKSGEVESVIVESDDRDYCNVVWRAAASPGQGPKIRRAQVGPGDTVEIG